MIREGACSLREQSKSRAGALLAFCVNQGILASFLSSIFLTAKFFPCLFLLLSILLPTPSSRGNPWIPLGLDPGNYSVLKRNELSNDEKTEVTFMHITECKKPVEKGYTLHDSNH